jgi:hypothetical protein
MGVPKEIIMTKEITKSSLDPALTLNPLQEVNNINKESFKTLLRTSIPMPSCL